MPQHWKTYKLGEFATFQRGFDLPSQNRCEGTIPIIAASGITGYHNQYKVKGPGVVTGRSGTIGQVMFSEIDFWPLNTSLWVKDFHENDPKFVYYFFKNFDFGGLNSGTSVPTLNRNDLHELEVTIPPLPEQRAIASILSALDDKIELNLQMNLTLEEMAMALYKHWFVDFGPFKDGKFVESELGMIPEGWEVGKLNQLLEVKYGKDHKKLEPGNIPVYGSGGIMRFVDTYLYDQESILIPRKGSLGNLFYMMKPFWSVDTMFYSKFKIPEFGKYIFHFLKTQDLASMDVGSAIPSLTTELLNKIEILIPPKSEVIRFNEVVSEYFQLIEANKAENDILKSHRDALLPKLISGEKSINN